MKIPKLLLSACCGPCATAAITELKKEYDITVLFWGSNLDSILEYEKRLDSLETVNRELNNNSPLIKLPYCSQEFLNIVAGKNKKAEYSDDILNAPEGGARCEICFEQRLILTAQYAKANGFNLFATALTVSPHKNAEKINAIGERVASEFGINYLPTNLKQSGGFQKSIELSKQLKLYRQNYCGCRYSKLN